MAQAVHITGVDVGSSMVRVAVASVERESGAPTLLGVGTAPLEGMQKGAVTDVEDAVRSVSAALDVAARVVGVPSARSFASIDGSHISYPSSPGVLAVTSAR